MKTRNAYVFAPFAVIMAGMGMISTFTSQQTDSAAPTRADVAPAVAAVESGEPKGCVFQTLFGEQSSDSAFRYKTPVRAQTSTEDGLAWISKAQLRSGGWGAGTHSRQDVMDPHAVKADPATTAMVAMALLRSGNTPTAGKYATNLALATDYLLDQVEKSGDAPNITDQSGTQPQRKLGGNIDVVMTSQYLSNLVEYLENNPTLKSRVKRNLDRCVAKIQQNMNQNGSMKGAGWAGVLQSSFAANALESARTRGAEVDEKKLDQARSYQKGNYDAESETIAVEEAAGVMLYSISGTARSSAREARIAKERIRKAKRAGKLEEAAEISVENLQKAGLSKDEAMRYGTAYSLNQAAKVQAQRRDVLNGFGSDGGEEFLSYLQTGEGLIMSKDIEWKKWYDNISGRMMKIQNADGSWNGHHCITSPVFCTATALLILSIDNDVNQLMAMGGEE